MSIANFSSYADVPLEVWGKIFACGPSISRIGNSRGYDTTILESIACVCKRWRDVCYSNQEWAPYVNLFRRHISKEAFPFNGSTADGQVRQIYLLAVNRCLSFTVESLKYVVEKDYELCLPNLLQTCDINIQVPFNYNNVSPPYKSESNDRGTILGFAIHSGSLRSLKMLLTNNNINCSEVIHYFVETWDDLQNDFILEEGYTTALMQALWELDCYCTPQRSPKDNLATIKKYIEMIRCLLEHDKVTIENAFSHAYTPTTKALIGKKCADLIAKKEPQALIPLLEAAAALKKEGITQLILSQVKTLGTEVFKDQFLELLCIAGDPQLETYLPRFNLNEQRQITLFDIATRYQHTHLLPLLQLQNPPSQPAKRKFEELEDVQTPSDEPERKKQKFEDKPFK